MKRRGGPIEEDDVGNGNPHSSRRHSKKNKKRTATGTRIETAQDGSPPRVAAAKDKEEDTTAQALTTKVGFNPDDLNQLDEENQLKVDIFFFFTQQGMVIWRS